MGKSKNAYIRYRIIHACLSNRQHRYWTLQELLEALVEQDFNIDRRTLERDLEAMRHDERLGYHAPIAYCRKERGYHYTDPTFSLDRLPLTTEDVQALTTAAQILQQYKGSAWVQQVEGAVDKIAKVVDFLKHPHNQKIMAFEKTPYYKGAEHIDRIIYAISNQQPLRIAYQKFDSDQPQLHILHPYFMKEYRGRWYVLGHSDMRHNKITLALDRMETIDDADIPFHENNVLEPETYFQHTLGITLGRGPVEEIILHFSRAQAPYIRTQHLHHSQQIIHDNEDGLMISLKLIINYELMQLLLSFGPEVEVVEPLSLRSDIKEMFEKGAGIYDLALTNV